jgi:hypothetical protein
VRRDPGLQPERTRLAWRRTALTVVVVALLAARLAVVRGAPLAIAGAALLWLAVLAVSHHRITAMSVPGEKRGPTRSPTLLALAILGYAVLGAILVLS